MRGGVQGGPPPRQGPAEGGQQPQGEKINLVKKLGKAQEENANLKRQTENEHNRNFELKNELKLKIEERSILMGELNKLRDEIVAKSKTVGLVDIMDKICKTVALSREGEATDPPQEQTRMVNVKNVEVPSWRVVEGREVVKEVEKEEEGVEDMRDEVYKARHARAEEERRQLMNKIKRPRRRIRKRGLEEEQAVTDQREVMKLMMQWLEGERGEEEVKGMDNERIDEKLQEVEDGGVEVVQVGFQVFQEFLGLRQVLPDTNVERRDCKVGEAKVVQEEKNVMECPAVDKKSH